MHAQETFRESGTTWPATPVRAWRKAALAIRTVRLSGVSGGACGVERAEGVLEVDCAGSTAADNTAGAVERGISIVAPNQYKAERAQRKADRVFTVGGGESSEDAPIACEGGQQHLPREQCARGWGTH